MDWIKIKDRLPQKKQNVIVFGKYGVDCCGYLSPYWKDAEITDWMPTPNKPHPKTHTLELTKKIEYDGEWFVPAEKLKELQRNVHDVPEKWKELDARIDTMVQSVELLGSNVIQLGPHWIAVKLIEWGFEILPLSIYGKTINND